MGINRRYRVGPRLMTVLTMLLLVILINLTLYAVTMRNAEKILAEAGVDMADPEFWRGGFAVVADLVDQLEALPPPDSD